MTYSPVKPTKIEANGCRRFEEDAVTKPNVRQNKNVDCLFSVSRDDCDIN